MAASKLRFIPAANWFDQRQAEGVQFGAIQCLIVPPEFLAGIDERFGLLAAPGVVTSVANGQRVAADPAVKQLMLGLGTDKGLHGVALFMAAPSSVISIKPIRHLADFKGKKIKFSPRNFRQKRCDALERHRSR